MQEQYDHPGQKLFKYVMSKKGLCLSFISVAAAAAMSCLPVALDARKVKANPVDDPDLVVALNNLSLGTFMNIASDNQAPLLFFAGDDFPVEETIADLKEAHKFYGYAEDEFPEIIILSEGNSTGANVENLQEWLQQNAADIQYCK